MVQFPMAELVTEYSQDLGIVAASFLLLGVFFPIPVCGFFGFFFFGCFTIPVCSLFGLFFGWFVRLKRTNTSTQLNGQGNFCCTKTRIEMSEVSVKDARS